SALHADGTPTGQVFTTETTSDAGDFEIDLPGHRFVSLEGTGFYFDEVTGSLSGASITLRSLGDPAGNQLYINPITHLVHARVLALVKGGATATSAEQQAESELRVALTIGPDGFDPHASAVDTTLLQGDDDASAYLFAVGAALLEAAKAQGGAKGAIDATFQQLLNTLASEFAPMGTLSAASQMTLHQAEVALEGDADMVMANLGARFQSIGVMAAVPNLHRVLDPDEDNLADIYDNCPTVFNPDQTIAPDGDGDGVACDAQSCNDGWKNDADPDVDCGGPCGATWAGAHGALGAQECCCHVGHG